MEKLYKKLENLKKTLDETETIKKLKQLNQSIMDDRELTSLIESYNSSPDDKIKELIIQNKTFRAYKHEEAELNLLILEINQELKKITKKDKCGL